MNRTTCQLYPSQEVVRHLAARDGVHTVPVRSELLADSTTPVEVLKKLKARSRHCFLLESVHNPGTPGRYSFIGCDPVMALSCNEGVMTCDGTSFACEHPLDEIRRIIREHASCPVEGMPPFTGGFVGYFSYDFFKYTEPSLRLDAQNPEGFVDLDVMFFDQVIAFDHFLQKIFLIQHVKSADVEGTYQRAAQRNAELAHLIEDEHVTTTYPGHVVAPFTPLFSLEEFTAMVKRAQKHIFEGDIFQVVLANRLVAPFEGSLLNLYRMLKTTNPSPYMFYLSGTDVEIAGASPETLVKVEGDRVVTYPLAGTRPRGATPHADAAAEVDLLSDEKECAEHDMLVDLGRNDLGKVAQIGSVELVAHRTIVRYSHVMHMASTIQARLAPGKDCLDALEAVLPAGTLSGAPKIRACQIINDLEGTKRGLYGGALGYIDLAGALDMCIAIRLAYKKNNKLFICSGAGIVADSDPTFEYQEHQNKARAVVLAAEKAGELA